MLGQRALKSGRDLFPNARNALSYTTCRLLLSIQHQHATRQQRGFSGKSLVSIKTKDGVIRRLQTLAIETSCDDTSVAVLSISGDADSSRLQSRVLFHEKITADSHSHGGIHPLVALQSHQKELGRLVQKAVRRLEPCSPGDSTPAMEKRRPDFVSVTRGPGMRSNLSVGVNVAKGLAVAWDVPLVGVHHMQAHALTARLCSTLNNGGDAGQNPERKENMNHPRGLIEWKTDDLEPRFPFLSLLVSGGHTMLIESKALTDHRILVETQDIAIGDFLDKAARDILTPSELQAPYGKSLEAFANSGDALNFDWYKPPKSRKEELERRTTSFGWSLPPPLAEGKQGGKSNKRMMYSFTGLLSSVLRLTGRSARSHETDDNVSGENGSKMPTLERIEVAREAQRLAFEHLGSRILLYLEAQADQDRDSDNNIPRTIIVSGGVASNKFLRHLLRSMLDARGYSNTKFVFPPPALCTDNALMIAWAGMEMYDAGYQSDLSIEPLRTWSMDPGAADGGILGVGGWRDLQSPT